MESRYRFLLLVFLLILSLVVRNYSSFPYPYNSISANPLNFYVGMLCFKYEARVLERMRKNRLVSTLFSGVLIALYTIYGESLNRIVTYGIILFCIMYSLLNMEVEFLEGSRKRLCGLNSLIIFLVFLHIPAQCIRDVILEANERDGLVTLMFPYVAYFSYTIILAVITAWIYSDIQGRLMPRFKSAMRFGIQSRDQVDGFL
jgi:hypothetical protein